MGERAGKLDGAFADARRGAPEPAQIRAARDLLAEHLPETRLLRARSVVSGGGAPVWLKLEGELPTGSFKVRGALFALSARLAEGPVDEVVASSTGNHGAAVAWAADLLGVGATIFLPVDPNPVKRARIAELGAAVVERGRDLAETFEVASAYAAEEGAYLLNDATDPNLPAGPATIAVEILERLPELIRLVVPVGDTALIRGMAAAVRERRPEVWIVGVQAEGAPAYALSWKEGRPVPTETCDTVADGLATRTPDEENVEAVLALVDDFVLVSEEELLHAVRRLLLDEHVVAEPAGAAALAGLAHVTEADGPTALVVSGSNLSEDVLRRAAALDGRAGLRS